LIDKKPRHGNALLTPDALCIQPAQLPIVRLRRGLFLHGLPKHKAPNVAALCRNATAKMTQVYEGFTLPLEIFVLRMQARVSTFAIGLNLELTFRRA
jgi:hypothetical protein